jgi:hypothetical protein
MPIRATSPNGNARPRSTAEKTIANALFGPIARLERPHGPEKLVAVWRDAAPRKSYDVIVIGGGHGLATCVYRKPET